MMSSLPSQTLLALPAPPFSLRDVFLMYLWHINSCFRFYSSNELTKTICPYNLSDLYKAARIILFKSRWTSYETLLVEYLQGLPITLKDKIASPQQDLRGSSVIYVSDLLTHLLLPATSLTSTLPLLPLRSLHSSYTGLSAIPWISNHPMCSSS